MIMVQLIRSSFKRFFIPLEFGVHEKKRFDLEFFLIPVYLIFLNMFFQRWPGELEFLSGELEFLSVDTSSKSPKEFLQKAHGRLSLKIFQKLGVAKVAVSRDFLHFFSSNRIPLGPRLKWLCWKFRFRRDIHKICDSAQAESENKISKIPKLANTSQTLRRLTLRKVRLWAG